MSDRALKNLIADNLIANQKDIIRLLIEAMKIVEQEDVSGERKKALVLDSLCLIFPDDREWLAEQIELFCSLGKASLGIIKKIKKCGCACSK